MIGTAFAVFDDSNFEAEVLRRKGLVVVDFWSSGCVPCKQLGRVLQQVAEELPQKVPIGTVDIGANPGLAERLNVKSVPTLLFFKDGKLVETRTGVDRRQVIKKLIETYAGGQS